MVDRVGNDLVKNSKAAETPFQFDFHLLNNRESINAFALPGEQQHSTVNYRLKHSWLVY